MINYNPKDWFGFLFRFHKADTFRKLFPLLVTISAYAWLIAFLELEVFFIFQKTVMSKIFR